MEKSIEQIWKKGFLNEDLIIPKIIIKLLIYVIQPLVKQF